MLGLSPLPVVRVYFVWHQDLSISILLIYDYIEYPSSPSNCSCLATALLVEFTPHATCGSGVYLFAHPSVENLLFI